MTNKIAPWADNMKLTVISFMGGPGIGKSTVAADVFSLMKRNKFKVEFLREIAKDHVWERRDNIFREQDYIFAKQHRLQRRLVGHDIEYAVTDSSLLLGLFYTPEDMPPSFKTFVRDVYDSYTNLNIYLERNPNIEYVEAGRNQDLDGAIKLDKEVLSYLESENIPYHRVLSGADAAQQVLDIVMKQWRQRVQPKPSPDLIARLRQCASQAVKIIIPEKLCKK